MKIQAGDRFAKPKKPEHVVWVATPLRCRNFKGRRQVVCTREIGKNTDWSSWVNWADLNDPAKWVRVTK